MKRNTEYKFKENITDISSEGRMITIKEFDNIIASQGRGGNWTPWERFDYKQCWTSTRPGYYTVIRSYNTKVAIVVGGILYFKQKYSVTTSKQLTQYANRHGLTKIWLGE